MKILNSKQNLSNVNFGGKAPDIDKLRKIRKFADCGLGDLASNLTHEVKERAPKLINNIDGFEVPKKLGYFRNAIEGVRDLFELPCDLIDELASRFPSSRLNNSVILKKYRGHVLKESQTKALQGIYEDGLRFIKVVDSKTLSEISNVRGQCTETCSNVCANVNKEFSKLLNGAMAFDKATYDTKKERLITRIVSGFTAAAFLGNDFFNSAKLKGKTDEEAKKSQKLKQGQEIKENILEGLMQFGLLSCFSSFVNANLWASALFGTAISMVSRVISRKSSGMRLTRMDVPEGSMKEFQKAIKEDREYKTQSEMDKEAKKPILSLKNILLLCLASVAGGFALRGLKLHTGIGRRIDKFLSDYSKEVTNKVSINVVATKKELETLSGILSECGEKKLSEITEGMSKTPLALGTTQRTFKIFGKIEVPVSEIRKLPLAPFKIVKEVISYPYKIAKNLANATGLIRDAKKTTIFTPEALAKELDKMGINKKFCVADLTKPMSKADFEKLILDPYEIKNIYLRFKQFESKYGNDSQKLKEEFSKYLKKMRLASLNNKTVSKVDNSKIAVIAQTTGTLSGMWFNMNDEFNAAVKNGDNKQEAQIAARKRGLNKFARMSSQVVISGTLNNLFKRQYQGSMIGAGLIVALSTFITDIVSRQMTAMPTKKMSKEEIEKYQKEHKEGFMSWYYGLIDKLAK